MVFHPCNRRVRYPNLLINGRPLERVTQINISCLILQSNVSWSIHTYHISLRVFLTPLGSLGAKVIPSVDQCNYLSIIISVKNSDKDFKTQMRKYYANANMLLRKFSYCSSDVKCCMFKSYCSTMHCSSMWFESTVFANTEPIYKSLRLLTDMFPIAIKI